MAPNRSWQTTPLDTDRRIQASVRPQTSARPLSDALAGWVRDRESTIARHVRAVSRATREWILSQGTGWSWEAAGADFESGVAPWEREQCWRGAAALWLDSMRRAWHWGSLHARSLGPTSVWSEELAHWIADPSDADARDEATTWNGEPLSAGARLSDRDALARSMAARLGRDEIVLLTSNCDSISRALVAARTAGSRVRALVAQGGPLRDGHRIAHTLARSNIPVTMCSDAAILQSVADVDRVWLFTEAIGSDGFLAPIGTTKIIEEAERHGVPVELFATSDTLIPGGAVSIPDWPARERATLWPDLSATIEIQTFLHEIVAMDSIESIGTEVGRETAAALSLRALRLEAAAPCAPSRDRDPDDD